MVWRLPDCQAERPDFEPCLRPEASDRPGNRARWERLHRRERQQVRGRKRARDVRSASDVVAAALDQTHGDRLAGGRTM